jgi:hypothetical protein
VSSEAILRYYQSLDCPKSLAAAILFRNGEFRQLLELTADPLHFNQSDAFRDAYLACNLLAKSQFLEAGFDREELAIQKFLKFEDQCKRTNKRFRNFGTFSEDDDSLKEDSFRDFSLLLKMRSKIKSILGAFSADEFTECASWGPGVSTRIKGEECHAAKKFQCEIGITRDLYPLAAELIPVAYPGWGQHLTKAGFPHFEVGNVVITVPKTSKIDRVIAIEPGINL